MKSCLLLLFLCSVAFAQNLVEIQTKTQDEDGAGMGTLGIVDLELVNLNFETCVIDGLNGSGNDFKEGEIDNFDGDDLQDCDGFPAPNHEIPLLILTHGGTDGWGCEWIRLVFDDGIYIECPDGATIDQGEEHTLECRQPGSGGNRTLELRVRKN